MNKAPYDAWFVLASDITATEELMTAAEYEACAAVSEKIYLIDGAVAEKLSDTGSPQGVFAVADKKTIPFFCKNAY